MEDNNVIKFALYLDGWDYETGDKKTLKKDAADVPVSEYVTEMKGHIFCPECCANLLRSPELKEFDTNGRKAFYAHSKKHQTNCSLRVKKAQGKRYDTEELAKKAIEDDELVVIKGFIKYKPEPPEIDGPRMYQGEPVEDQYGELAKVPISRHNGESFNLPSKITTVRGICRNFNKNLYKYFHLPGQKNAIQLKNLLTDIRTVKDVDREPKFYFGTIKNSWNMGNKPTNIRFAMFEYPEGGPKDFCLKATNAAAAEHGINDDSVGKVVIMFGSVASNGIGLCIQHLGWGEFAVLPDQYAGLLP